MANIVIRLLISIVLIFALLIGNLACYANANLITTFLCGAGYTEDSEEAMAARESGKVLAAQVASEGAVLMKNENGVLPLKNLKVNVFGWSGSDDGFIPQGTGSGTGSRNDLVTFLGGLKEAGIEYNENLAKAYDDLGWVRAKSGSWVIEAHGATYKDYYGVTEAPESFYTDSLMADAKAYSDTAIIVVGRLMGEGNDFSKTQYFSNQAGGGEDSTRKLQSLSEREEYMISLVCENFENVILVVNCANPMELGFADEAGVDSVLYMGYPGTRGAIGFAKLLTGEVNPSGRLADTWAYDLSTAASYATSGLEGVSTYTDKSKASYTEYRENIYNGYLWYETADAEGFWNGDLAESIWGVKSYADVVQYPFGFGLSYTDFDWEIHEINFQDGATACKNDTLEVTVRVTNTGDVAGRDVVELYYSAPYTKGGIEKAAIKLGGFGKTPKIEPGQFADVVIEMPIEEMKSYDCYDMNNNGFMGYELEKGSYVISFRSDVHTLKAGMEGSTITLNVAEDIRYEFDSATGTVVKNQFTNYTNPVSGASSTVNEPFIANAHSIDGADNEGGAIQYVTRADIAGTFPQEKGKGRPMGALYEDMDKIYTPIDPDNIVVPEFNSTKTQWNIQDLMGVEYDDPMWDEIISQLSYDECREFILSAGFGTMALESIGKPRTKDADGPSGFNNSVTGDGNLKAVNYPSSVVLAQTWDWYAAYQVGIAIGIEGNALGITGWYGPGGNTHRSAMGGRNFEYYSEDAFLSGTMCAYHVLGAKEQGIQVYIKHIGLNEDDASRVNWDAKSGCYKWVTEQAFREIYLKPFEYAVKLGDANGLMASHTRTGGMKSSGTYAMLTAVVRDEWGFRGTVITDYYKNNSSEDMDECIRAGCNQMLHPDGYVNNWLDDTTSDAAKYYVHKSAKDLLYAYVDTMYYAETAQGLENGSIVGAVSGVEVIPWWKTAVLAVDVAALVALGAWNILGFKKNSF